MWLKIDDRLHDHRKARKAGKAAMGLWVLAGSWAAANDTDGFIPADVIPRWGVRADADKLVRAGFWVEDERDGDPGWRFHDWADYNPPAVVTAAKRDKEREGAARGNHKRWHVNRGILDESCDYCYRPPDRVPDEEGDLPPDRVRIGSLSHVPVPDPIPVSPDGEKLPPGTAVAVPVPIREDVDRVCEHLADRIAEDGSKRPRITQGWRDQARLMLDKDGRTESDVHTAIDWCQSHHFWRTNILSMPTLREKYDQLRKVAASERAQAKPRHQQERDSVFAKAAERMGITGVVG